MALLTLNEIKDRITEVLEIIPETYPDELTELADSAVPVYYSEIIAEWAELPMSESDRWQEMGMSETATITDRMSADLYLYYSDRFYSAYGELCEELEEQETN